MPQNTTTRSDLIPHWLLCATFLILIFAYNIICQIWGTEIQTYLDESSRVFIRSILYGIAIILFPTVNLLRHILIRLNQTMPGNMPPHRRYLVTLSITLLLIETVGIFGFLMFIMGDNFNTLYIFSLLAVLGIFLHRPKFSEYLSICGAMNPD